ncbi:hypothetical protein ADUPG1_004964 [Aduncisulcus paluster]|uniref:Uncharacterized protein n=1 Tax=Aduncisulcus paluster TaxID=2918883 RepID=A0ABQ5K7L0_9EUKA|nr:hypothetical protein ADUPG1_004964 [Aduncisulcus paluster]
MARTKQNARDKAKNNKNDPNPVIYGGKGKRRHASKRLDTTASAIRAVACLPASPANIAGFWQALFQVGDVSNPSWSMPELDPFIGLCGTINTFAGDLTHQLHT